MPLRIGLTGGIGSGKSTVATMLSRHGASVIDTDAIARRLTAAGGAAMPALRLAFGDAISGTDGALDRNAMRALAFTDPAAKRRLEDLLHPLIDAAAQSEAAALDGPVIVFDVPLLAESPRWRARVDRVLVIDCSEATQVGRAMQRPGWTRDAVQLVIASQAARSTRRAIADAVIHNDGIALDALGKAVTTIWRLWQFPTRGPVEQ